MQVKVNKGAAPRPNQSGSCTGAAGWTDCKEELLQVSQAWKVSVQALKGGVDGATIPGTMATFLDAAPGSMFTANMKKAMVGFIAEVCSGCRYQGCTGSGCGRACGATGREVRVATIGREVRDDPDQDSPAKVQVNKQIELLPSDDASEAMQKRRQTLGRAGADMRNLVLAHTAQDSQLDQTKCESPVVMLCHPEAQRCPRPQ